MTDIKPDIDAIWYVHVEKDDPSKASEGDWFYDPVAEVQCGEAIQDETGLWTLYIDVPYEEEQNLIFDSLKDVKFFVSNHFNRKVIGIDPKCLRLDEESF